MNYFSSLSYAVEKDLLIEEVSFLIALFHIHEHDSSDMSVHEIKINQQNIVEYYSSDKYPWFNMVNSLIEKGFIIDYRTNKEKESKNLNVTKIQVTDKFKETFFIDKDLAYSEAISVYPDKIKTFGTSAKLGLHEKLKHYYYSKIIKGGDKTLHIRFVQIVKEMFDFDERRQTPMKPADAGWEKFLQSWEYESLAFEKAQKSSNSSFTNLL